MITIQDMVQREIHCCMSSLVAALDGGAGCIDASRSTTDAGPAALADLAMQALELAIPIPDYEEAALQAGFSPSKTQPGLWSNEGATFKPGEEPMFWDDAAEACSEQDIEPYGREVFEHWAVSDWLADKLIAKGEKVDKDFAGLCIWARTTTGQAIHADGVIEAIYKEAMAS